MAAVGWKEMEMLAWQLLAHRAVRVEKGGLTPLPLEPLTGLDAAPNSLLVDIEPPLEVDAEAIGVGVIVLSRDVDKEEAPAGLLLPVKGDEEVAEDDEGVGCRNEKWTDGFEAVLPPFMLVLVVGRLALAYEATRAEVAVGDGAWVELLPLLLFPPVVGVPRERCHHSVPALVPVLPFPVAVAGEATRGEMRDAEVDSRGTGCRILLTGDLRVDIRIGIVAVGIVPEAVAAAERVRVQRREGSTTSTLESASS